MDPNIAVIGLGAMGGRAAARLAAADRAVDGFDPAPPARKAATQSQVRVTDSPKDAVRDADVILLSLPGPEQVLATARTIVHHAKAGSVVVDISTIDPATARDAADVLAAQGITYVDSPVLGRPERCGHWTLVAGGDAQAIEQARTLLVGAIASRMVRIGEIGAGSVVKLLNNLMFGAINAVTAEALAACHDAGVDPTVFADTVADSGAATVSNLFRELAPKIAEHDYSPTFTLKLLHKDNRLALRLIQETGTPSLLSGAVDLINTLALQAGLGDQDTGAVHELFATETAPA